MSESREQSRKSTYVGCGLAFLLALALYAPSLGFDFSGWDDGAVFSNNPRLLHPGFDSLHYYWTHPEFDLYVPVTQTVWWTVAQFARTTNEAGASVLTPGPFHAANVLIHAGAGACCFALLRRLNGRPAAAFVGAALFVVHPLQVETVCWAAATKDLLAGLFGLLALLVHQPPATSSLLGLATLTAPPRPNVKRVTASTVLCLAALLSKPSAVVLPAVAVLIDVGLCGVAVRVALARAVPWIVAAVPVAIVAKLVQPGYPQEGYGVVERISVAIFSLTFYLSKLVWPLDLAFDYGRTPQVVAALGGVAGRGLALAALTVVCGLLRRRFASLSVGLAIFVVAIAPVLGLVPFDFQIYSTVGDHYVYLAMLGAAVPIAMLPRPWMLGLAGGAIVVASVLAGIQAQTWRTRESMARHNLMVTPASWASRANLASALAAEGEVEPAVGLAREARRMQDVEMTRKMLAEVLVVRGDAEAALGDRETALATYHEALSIFPGTALGWTNLAATLAEVGRLDDALAAYQKADQIAPGNATAAAGMAAVRAAMRSRPPATQSGAK